VCSGAPCWNAGAWFGAQLGGTTWMAVAALAFARLSGTLALELLGLFLASNVVGLWLCSRRTRLDPYVGLQLVMAVAGLCSLAAFALIRSSGLVSELPRWVGVRDFRTSWLLAYPAVILVLHLRQRAARRTRG
jgi:hypothetical protein